MLLGIIIGAFTDQSHGRIGSTLDECMARYGNEIRTFERDQSKIHVFQKLDFTIEATFADGKVVQISYRKDRKTPPIEKLPDMSLEEWHASFGASPQLLRREDGSTLHRFNAHPLILEAWFKDARQQGEIRYLSEPQSYSMAVPMHLLGKHLSEWRKEFGSPELVQGRKESALYEWRDQDRRLQAWFTRGVQHGLPGSFVQSEVPAHVAGTMLDRSTFSSADRETLIKNNIRAAIIEDHTEESGITVSYAVADGQKLRIAVFDPKTNTLVITDPAKVLTEPLEKRPETSLKDL